MILLEILNIIFLTAYISFIVWLIIGWLKQSNWNEQEEELRISVLIPFRNEEENLVNIVRSFCNLNYNLNLVEFVFIDDHSLDNGASVLLRELDKTNLLYKIIKQKENLKGKKNAIITGVKACKYDYIVTTDADCMHSRFWLLQYAKAFNNNAEFIIAPVINKPQNNFIGKLQNIESFVLSGVTIGTAKNKNPFLCSGANMGYKKTLFNSLNPYQSNLDISSGDDLFFLDSVLQHNCKVSVLDSPKALVFTKPPTKYAALIQQALRWSSKNVKLRSKRNFWLSILVFIVNLLIIPNLIFINFYFSSLFLSVKFLVDFTFFSLITIRFGQKALIFLTPFIYFLYPIHLLIIFAKSFYTKVQWKGRKLEIND